MTIAVAVRRRSVILSPFLTGMRNISGNTSRQSIRNGWATTGRRQNRFPRMGGRSSSLTSPPRQRGGKRFEKAHKPPKSAPSLDANYLTNLGRLHVRPRARLYR
jgi:hypothetical protein